MSSAEREQPSQGCCNLADPELGGAVIRVSDEFFAPAKRMLAASEPEFIPELFDAHGKWMDGWESRRRRDDGHDYCVVRICPGIVYGVDIDTRHFTGNFAPTASIEACCVDSDPDARTSWQEILPPVALAGDQHHYLRIGDRHTWTHLRVNVYPDGGIARFRVYGVPQQPQVEASPGHRWVDLACAEIGGEALACSDMHFGDMANLLKASDPVSMADGWETRRRRTPGNDWVILKLGAAGVIRRIDVDTAFFKGNYPASCSLRGAALAGENPDLQDSEAWPLILERVALGPDQSQSFRGRCVREHPPVTHVRFDIYPDGGVARLRLLGEVVDDQGN
jgi:allantoicase